MSDKSGGESSPEPEQPAPPSENPPAEAPFEPFGTEIVEKGDDSPRETRDE